MDGMYSISEINAFVAAHWQDQAGNPLRTFISPYGYSLSFTGLAQNATATQQLTIQNIDFVLLRLGFRASIGAAETESGLIAPFARVLVSDNGSGEQFTNTAVDLEAAMSNGQRAIWLGYPRILQGKSSLSVQLTSWAPVAETYAIDIVFDGVQVRTY